MTLTQNAWMVRQTYQWYVLRIRLDSFRIRLLQPVLLGTTTDHIMQWVYGSIEPELCKDTNIVRSPKSRGLQLDLLETANKYIIHSWILMRKNQLWESTNPFRKKQVIGQKVLRIIVEPELMYRMISHDMMIADNRCCKVKAWEVA